MWQEFVHWVGADIERSAVVIALMGAWLLLLAGRALPWR